MVQRSHERDDYGYPLRPDGIRKIRKGLIQVGIRLILGVVNVSMSLVGIFLKLQQMGKRREPLTAETFKPRRILVARMDLIGDVVLSLTVVRALKRRYPEAEIDLLALPSSAQVVEQDPDLAQVITYDTHIWRRPRALFVRKNWREIRALKKRLRDRHYELAVSVLGSWAALLTVLSGARRRVGFAKESYPGFMTDSAPGAHWQEGDHLHEVDYCLKLARTAGATPIENERTPNLYVAESVQQQAVNLLQEAGVQVNKPIIACHVSSNNGQSKRWPIPYWATLIDKLITEEGANVVLTGAKGDLPLIEQIMQRAHERPINMAGKTSLIQLAGLLKQADILITGDSGPMHIAAAVGTPLIAIHGPTDPAMSGPVSTKATVLRREIWCSPCYTALAGPADCRFFTTQCMKDITPAQVLTVARQKLQEIPVDRQARLFPT